MSSADNVKLPGEEYTMSFINVRNGSGPRREHHGTPILIGKKIGL